jgi:hypothetical protein
VTTGEECNQRLIDYILLAINDSADGGAGGTQLATQALDVG